MLNVFTLENGRLSGRLFQEEKHRLEIPGRTAPVWIDMVPPEPSPMVTQPVIVAPGATWTPSPRTDSWSTLALVLMMQACPKVTSVQTVAWARI